MFCSFYHYLRPELLLEWLVDPIPRAVLDSILTCTDIDAFLEILQMRRSSFELAASGKFPARDFQKDMHPSLKNVCCIV